MNELQVGHYYLVRTWEGPSPMELVSLTNPPHKTTVTFETPAGMMYWADPKHVGAEVHAWWFELYQQHTGDALYQAVNSYAQRRIDPRVKA